MTIRVPEITIHTHPVPSLHDPERVSSIHRGELVHLALYFLDHFVGLSDIERAVLRAFSLTGLDKGRWNIERDYLRPLLNALSLPQVRPWFEPGVRSLREVEVTDARGELHRIDRVVIGQETLEVLDFKLGQREEDHGAQVALYKGLIETIFRRPTRGYLLYIDEPTLVRVP